MRHSVDDRHEGVGLLALIYESSVMSQGGVNQPHFRTVNVSQLVPFFLLIHRMQVNQAISKTFGPSEGIDPPKPIVLDDDRTEFPSLF